jgi:hypothetical protein
MLRVEKVKNAMNFYRVIILLMGSIIFIRMIIKMMFIVPPPSTYMSGTIQTYGRTSPCSVQLSEVEELLCNTYKIVLVRDGRRARVTYNYKKQRGDCHLLFNLVATWFDKCWRYLLSYFSSLQERKKASSFCFLLSFH